MFFFCFLFEKHFKFVFFFVFALKLINTRIWRTGMTQRKPSLDKSVALQSTKSRTRLSSFTGENKSGLPSKTKSNTHKRTRNKQDSFGYFLMIVNSIYWCYYRNVLILISRFWHYLFLWLYNTITVTEFNYLYIHSRTG